MTLPPNINLTQEEADPELFVPLTDDLLQKRIVFQMNLNVTLHLHEGVLTRRNREMIEKVRFDEASDVFCFVSWIGALSKKLTAARELPLGVGGWCELRQWR